MNIEKSASTADRLLAIEEIKALSARYALGLDTFDMETLLEPWAADAIFDATAFGLGKYTGHEEMRSFFQHNFDVMDDQMHLYSNFLIEFDGPASASGTVYLYEDGHLKEGAHVKALCVNHDKYIRDEGDWKISRRIVRSLVTAQLEGFQETM